jgi:hypothetical protein
LHEKRRISACQRRQPWCNSRNNKEQPIRKNLFVVLDDSEPNLFGWKDKPPVKTKTARPGRRGEDSAARQARIARSAAKGREEAYEAWKRLIAKHLWEDYCVILKDAFDWRATSEEALRAAYEKNKEAFRVVDAIADQEDWDPNLYGPRGHISGGASR